MNGICHNYASILPEYFSKVFYLGAIKLLLYYFSHKRSEVLEKGDCRKL